LTVVADDKSCQLVVPATWEALPHPEELIIFGKSRPGGPVFTFTRLAKKNFAHLGLDGIGRRDAEYYAARTDARFDWKMASGPTNRTIAGCPAIAYEFRIFKKDGTYVARKFVAVIEGRKSFFEVTCQHQLYEDTEIDEVLNSFQELKAD
jgi:hypothetical protein